jgi:hypothetical protein
MRAPLKKTVKVDFGNGTWVKRCIQCGRRGTRAFEWVPNYGWQCSRVDACDRRTTIMGLR